MRHKNWILAAWIVLCPFVAARGAGDRYSIRVWPANVLPEGAVLAITQTHDGYLWFGTLKGLVRFDGFRPVAFDDNDTPGLPGNDISFLFEDRETNLWMGTRSAGLARLAHGRVAAITVPQSAQAGFISSACEDASGAVWLYTANGKLLRYRDGRMDVGAVGDELPSNCRLIIAEKSGPIWLGTDHGLYTTGPVTNFAALSPPNFKVSGIAKVDYLVASAAGGFWCLADGHIQRWRNGRLERDLGAYPWDSSVHVSSGAEDRLGNLVIGTQSDGVYWFDASGKPAHLTQGGEGDQGLPNKSILSLFVDREGNLWIGTNGGGLVRVRRSPFEVLPESLGRTVQSICEDNQGGLWVGYNGASINTNSSGALQYFKDGLQRQLGTNLECLIHSVMVASNQLVWVGTWGPWEQWQFPSGSLFTNSGSNFSPAPFLFRVNGASVPGIIQAISVVFQDRRGLLWIGARQGLFSWDGQQWKAWVTNGLSSTDVRAIADDSQGEIWVGTEHSGLNRLQNDRFQTFHKSDGLPSEHISGLCADRDGVLWVATSGGLAWLKNGKWSRYTSAEGLTTDSLDYLLDDQSGFLWLGSNRGLIRVSKQALALLSNGSTNFVSCRAYGESDGLPNDECTSGSQPAACRTHDGRLWFPTINSLVSINPADIIPNTNPPPIVIESVSVEGIPQGSSALGAESPSRVTLPAGREHLDIQYTSLNLAAADKARFRYRMEGYESRWVDAGARRVAPYPKLPPGDYQFRVSACNEDGIWSERPATLAVKVLPPFWQTSWFITLASLATLGLIVGGVHYVSTQKLQRQLAGLKQQQALEQERARIARDIHDQLGASLTQVSLLGEMVESDKDSPGEIVTHARQISQTARDTSRALDEIVWTVNPSNDTLEGLANYLCKYAQEYLGVAGLKYRLDAPARLPATSISPEVRHNVFLAAKEAITNIVRHSGATSAFLRLRVEDAWFILEIQDDGRGIPDLAEKLAGSRHGLRNMTRRMADVGGKFEVLPAPVRGVIIRLSVPVQSA